VYYGSVIPKNKCVKKKEGRMEERKERKVLRHFFLLTEGRKEGTEKSRGRAGIEKCKERKRVFSPSCHLLPPRLKPGKEGKKEQVS
jgi:hypothetical protein